MSNTVHRVLTFSGGTNRIQDTQQNILSSRKVRESNKLFQYPKKISEIPKVLTPLEYFFVPFLSLGRPKAAGKAEKISSITKHSRNPRKIREFILSPQKSLVLQEKSLLDFAIPENSSSKSTSISFILFILATTRISFHNVIFKNLSLGGSTSGKTKFRINKVGSNLPKGFRNSRTGQQRAPAQRISEKSPISSF